MTLSGKATAKNFVAFIDNRSCF